MPIRLFKSILILCFVSVVAACGTTSATVNKAVTTNNFVDPSTYKPTKVKPRILTIGDSMMSWNTVNGNSVPQSLAEQLGETVQSRAVPGAKMILMRPTLIGMSIPGQFINKKWDTVVLNGGGNDIWQGCGCGKCAKTLDKLISADGQRGKIPMLVKYAMLPNSKHVIYSGYLRTPGLPSIVDGCGDEADELERRLQVLDRQVPRFHFVSMRDLVPSGSARYHDVDMVHPSVMGSRAIANRVARKISQLRR